jgi:hypothetical protein
VSREYTTDAASAAVDFRERGWSAIPLKARSKAPRLPKRHPFLSRKATDAEYRGFDFRHNVGIVTGKVSGIIVLDDDDHGETLREKGWHVPPTPTAKTRRGHQYYFRCPEAGFPTFDVAGKLEVRGDGAYTVAPPSVHPSGTVYEWAIPPDETELADPPPWLVEQARLRGRRMKAEAVGEVIANGSRNKVLFSLAGTLRRRGLDEAAIAAALLGINDTTCETPLEEDEVRRIARSAARYEVTGPFGSPEAGKGSSSEARGLLGTRTLLAEGMVKGIEPPEELERGVILRGRVHWVYAPAGLGKTWLWLWLVKRCIERGERVLVFDAENGPRIAAERLEALGVPTERIDELLHYHAFPHLSTEREVAEEYLALLDEIRPALIVFDSLVNFLGSAGLEENSNDDLIRWATVYTRPAREREIACLVLDHTPHDGDHARGASRKRDEADVMFALRCPVPFDRDCVGAITLRRDKDREAWLPERVRFSVGGTEDGFIFRRSDGTIEEPDPESGLTGTQRRTLDALRDDFGERGATASEWKRAAKSRGVSEPSFWRAKRTITLPKKEGLVIVGSDSRFRAVLPPESEKHDGGESLIDKPDSGNYHGLSKDYHDSGDSGLLSSLSPPLKGDSDDSTDTGQSDTLRDRLAVAPLVRAVLEEEQHAPAKNLPHYLTGSTTLAILTNSVLGELGVEWKDLAEEERRRWERLVEEAAGDPANHPVNCPCEGCL